jgi:hypothetical protein
MPAEARKLFAESGYADPQQIVDILRPCVRSLTKADPPAADHD